ncbi:MAG: biotin synthase [Hydrocarboniphaga sp.]|uniref:class I SAM-dependent methyltransferase n=1 Tax=Hydrocarboniphaga sp. TaxID=2033016 RepID=UPI00260E4D5D|nr:class I SAM-dependent methyltransferase [Hydrocarboniphaga sp.]MDB5971981.1 biotin synthase [Hydrocarboniphaga sp.]
MSETPILDPVQAYALWAASYPARAHNPVMQAEQRALLSLMPDDLSRQRVLDAGCGSGRYVLQALRRGAGRVIGVDLSTEMLQRAGAELQREVTRPTDYQLIQGSLDALPVHDAWADLTICGLTIGHLQNLREPLAELCRVTRPGGTILCSDVHPIGHALGWLRDFTCEGQRYAVRHTPYLYSDWHTACGELGLRIERVIEPMLDPADIPQGARFDPVALKVPVALVLQLKRQDRALTGSTPVQGCP